MTTEYPHKNENPQLNGRTPNSTTAAFVGVRLRDKTFVKPTAYGYRGSRRCPAFDSPRSGAVSAWFRTRSIPGVMDSGYTCVCCHQDLQTSQIRQTETAQGRCQVDHWPGILAVRQGHVPHKIIQPEARNCRHSREWLGKAIAAQCGNKSMGEEQLGGGPWSLGKKYSLLWTCVSSAAN